MMKAFGPSFRVDRYNNGSYKVFMIAMLLCCYCHSQCIAETTGELCPEVDENSESCVCKTSKGIIDLSALSYRNGTARFRTITDSKHYYYDFNPCQAFDAEGSCINIHVCQGANFDGSAHYSIADQGTEEIWIDRNEGPYLYYTGAGNREVKVFLHCDLSFASGEAKLSTTGDSIMKLTYLFDLYSCHACPGGCDFAYSRSKAGPLGLSIIILALIGFITYLVIGTIILKFHFGFTGKDVLPHINFWNALPSLIQDGISFSVGTFIHSIARPKQKQSRLDYETQL